MRALILAAGFASRLRPLTDSIPKCLLEIGGQAILGRMLQYLFDHGIREVGIVTGYRASQITDYIIREFPRVDVTFLHNNVYQTTNNIYSLYLARQFALDHDIYLLDSDIIFDRRILELLNEYPRPDCLAMRSYGPIGEEEMKVTTGVDGRIVDISKRIPPEEASGESIGVEKFSAGFMNRLFSVLTDMIENQGQSDQFYEEAFKRVIDQGHPLFAVDVGQFRCVEVDTLDDLQHAETEVSQFIDR